MAFVWNTVEELYSLFWELFKSANPLGPNTRHVISILQIFLISDLLIVYIFQSGYLNHPLIGYHTKSFWTKMTTLS